MGSGRRMNSYSRYPSDRLNSGGNPLGGGGGEGAGGGEGSIMAHVQMRSRRIAGGNLDGNLGSDVT